MLKYANVFTGGIVGMMNFASRPGELKLCF
jgi:hypothetical protein